MSANEADSPRHGAHLQGLRRTAIAKFYLENAYSLDQLEAMTMPEREACLLPLDCLLQELPMLELDAERCPSASSA